MVSPSRPRQVVEQVCSELGVPERRACQVIDQPRSTQRRVLRVADDEERLTAAIIELASQYGRYGYGSTIVLLRASGWVVNKKRVERIWRREGLKVPRAARSMRPPDPTSLVDVTQRPGPMGCAHVRNARLRPLLTTGPGGSLGVIHMPVLADLC